MDNRHVVGCTYRLSAEKNKCAACQHERFYQVNTQRRNAFTLVELLVVILIITILTALLLPSIESAREAAYSASCASRQRQLMSITHEYNQDYRMLLGQKVTITKPDGTRRTFFGYHLLYEGGYLSTDNFNVVNSSSENAVANAWRKGNSCLLMCPAARFHGHNGGGGAFGHPNWSGGLEELVFIGDKNRWRDLWSTNSTSWSWGNTALTDQFNPYYGASAISSYSMPRETRHYTKVSTIVTYAPLRFVQNPSRKIWWIESRGPDLAGYYIWINQAIQMRNNTITGTSYPSIRLPHPYAKGGNYATYDGHVEQYSFNEMIETSILSNWNVYGLSTQSVWPRFEFSAAEEEIQGAFTK